MDPVLEEATREESEPGTVEATGVFVGFLTACSDRDREQPVSLQLQKTTTATKVGTKLAAISEKIERDYGKDLDSMVSMFGLGVAGEEGVEARFRRVISKVLNRGEFAFCFSLLFIYFQKEK